MSKVIITASNAGFFNESPLGLALAPNVFLKTDVNIYGAITSNNTGWESAESKTYDDFGIDIITDLDQGIIGKLGKQMKIEFSGITYYRNEGGERTVTATMQLPSSITLTATYDQISTDTYGWIAEAGSALEKLLQTDGFIFNGGHGDDIFAPHKTILPTYADNIIRGRGGDDQLTGSLGDDRIMGGSGDDILYDPDGTNFLNGQAGDDVLTLGDGSDGSTAKGGHGNDRLYSGAGDDTLRGGRGDDILDGGRGNDALYGGRGDDILNGGAGSDFLKGHAGADQFIFNTEDQGHDKIADFTDNVDLIVLEGGESFDDLTFEQQGKHTLITWGSDSDLLLLNFDSGLLDSTDFVFG